MRVAKSGELVDRATLIQRTGSLERGHQNALVRRQDLCGLAHEPHTRDNKRICRVISSKASHLQRVRYTAAGGLSQSLDLRRSVVMRNNHRVVRFELRANTVLQLSRALSVAPLWHAGEVRLHLFSNFLQFLISDRHAKKPSQ